MFGALIAAAAALFGVTIGGLITSFNQAQERYHRRLREQADEFYGPMVGIREEILAKSESRETISGFAEEEWQKLVRPFHGKPDALQRIMDTRWPDFEKRIKYEDRQLTQELIPSYKQMLEHFAAHMSLAESSTRKHFPELVRFIEIWNRSLDKSLPHEVRVRLEHDERRLESLYVDLENQLDRLSREAAKEPELPQLLRKVWDRLLVRASGKR
jgi:uncharacterized protein Usg